MPKSSNSLKTKAKLFRGLADLSRLVILEALSDGPMTVNEIASAAGLSQPNASLHLDCLWCCGLVEREAKGRFTYYWISSKKIRKFLGSADLVLGEVSERIRKCEKYK